MENLKTIVKASAAVFVLGIFLTLGVRIAELAWPKDETTVRIVHYLCSENEDEESICRRIKGDNIGDKLTD